MKFRLCQIVQERHSSRLLVVVALLLWCFVAPVPSNAQLAEGDIVVLEAALTTPEGPAALIAISPTGQRTVLTDFRSSAQGSTSDTPIGFVLESKVSVLVFGQKGITRVALPGGQRTTVGSVAGSMVGSLAGLYRLTPSQGIYTVNASTGQSKLLSDFKSLNQGPVPSNANSIQLEPTGDILLLCTDGKLYRVNSSTGQRVSISTVGEGESRIGGPTFSIIGGIASIGNDIWVLTQGNRGNAPVYGIGGALWKVNRDTGASALVSVFNDPAQGPIGSIYMLQPIPQPQLSVDSKGTVLAVATTLLPPIKSMVFRIDPKTGSRTVLSDFGDSRQGPALGGFITGVQVATASLPTAPISVPPVSSPPPISAAPPPTSGSSQNASAVGAAPPAAAPASPAATFQNSLDGKYYELMPRGDLGLDIYSADGRLVAVMDRKKVGEDYKGKTQVLATQCPDNTGKIETRDVKPDRVRMRVEVAQRTITNTTSCNVLVLTKWQEFDLVRSARPSEAAPQTTTAPATDRAPITATAQASAAPANVTPQPTTAPASAGTTPSSELPNLSGTWVSDGCTGATRITVRTEKTGFEVVLERWCGIELGKRNIIEDSVTITCKASQQACARTVLREDPKIPLTMGGFAAYWQWMDYGPRGARLTLGRVLDLFFLPDGGLSSGAAAGAPTLYHKE
jgi:hypothetical protein